MNEQPRAVVEAALERVLQSVVFRRSERHRGFMRYVVEAALGGRGDTLKEVLIGIEFFDRKLEDYDPRSDPIVRVEAGRIRAKLARYYLSEGSGERFGFDIPVGGYVPRFERRRPASPSARAAHTYAILPFATRGGEDAGFAIGLADQIINLLGRVRDLRVIARVSSFQARERDLDIKGIAKLLGVTRVVDGSFQRHGDRIRCIVHIYSGVDATQVWSQTFDSSDLIPPAQGPVDLFAFQDHVAEGIVSAALPTIDGAFSRTRPAGRTDASGSAGPTVTAAMQREARYLLDHANHLYRRFDAATCVQAADLAEQAAALDPGNAQCHVLVALASFAMATLGVSSGSAVRPRIEAALARALALDPADSEALALEGMTAFRLAFDWARAARLFETALRISPHAGAINYRYAFCLIMNGRFVEGLQHLDAALALDPLHVGFRASAAHLRAVAGDLPTAHADADVVLRAEPGHIFTNVASGMIYLYEGKHAAALERFDRAISLFPDLLFASFARVATIGRAGDVIRGTRELDALLARLETRHWPRYGLAIACLGLGRREAAYAALEAAAADGDPTFCSVGVDPLFVACHDDPRFVALLARFGLRPAVPA